jgi:NTP pyrophosphatase (non-canonical NTP hydrolase)
MTLYEHISAEQSYIASRIPVEEMLSQLAEEACELAHAALKLRRVLDGTNPAPIDLHTATEALREEVADLALVCKMLALDGQRNDIEAIMDEKLARWYQRLKEREDV